MRNISHVYAEDSSIQAPSRLRRSLSVSGTNQDRYTVYIQGSARKNDCTDGYVDIADEATCKIAASARHLNIDWRNENGPFNSTGHPKKCFAWRGKVYWNANPDGSADCPVCKPICTVAWPQSLEVEYDGPGRVIAGTYTYEGLDPTAGGPVWKRDDGPRYLYGNQYNWYIGPDRSTNWFQHALPPSISSLSSGWKDVADAAVTIAVRQPAPTTITTATTTRPLPGTWWNRIA